jgi:hypothetical protein
MPLPLAELADELSEPVELADALVVHGSGVDVSVADDTSVLDTGVVDGAALETRVVDTRVLDADVPDPEALDTEDVDTRVIEELGVVFASVDTSEVGFDAVPDADASNDGVEAQSYEVHYC